MGPVRGTDDDEEEEEEKEEEKEEEEEEFNKNEWWITLFKVIVIKWLTIIKIEFMKIKTDNHLRTGLRLKTSELIRTEFAKENQIK